jgi:hypothetical protein
LAAIHSATMTVWPMMNCGGAEGARESLGEHAEPVVAERPVDGRDGDVLSWGCLAILARVALDLRDRAGHATDPATPFAPQIHR